jgi:hypothetical protein
MKAFLLNLKSQVPHGHKVFDKKPVFFFQSLWEMSSAGACDHSRECWMGRISIANVFYSIQSRPAQDQESITIKAEIKQIIRTRQHPDPVDLEAHQTALPTLAAGENPSG